MTVELETLFLFIVIWLKGREEQARARLRARVAREFQGGASRPERDVTSCVPSCCLDCSATEGARHRASYR